MNDISQVYKMCPSCWADKYLEETHYILYEEHQPSSVVFLFPSWFHLEHVEYTSSRLESRDSMSRVRID